MTINIFVFNICYLILIQNDGMKIKKKFPDDSCRTADIDVILSTVNMMNANMESTAAITVLIILCLPKCLILKITF